MLVVLGVGAGERVRCAMRHAADDASLGIVRAANARGVRGGLEGRRERGCAKKAATAEGAVMPLEEMPQLPTVILTLTN